MRVGGIHKSRALNNPRDPFIAPIFYGIDSVDDSIGDKRCLDLFTQLGRLQPDNAGHRRVLENDLLGDGNFIRHALPDQQDDFSRFARSPVQVLRWNPASG